MNKIESILERVFPRPRQFTLVLPNTVELPAQGDPAFRLILHHPGSIRRMFAPPLELSLGEAYIRGDFDIEGDILAAFPLLEGLGRRSFSLAELGSLAANLLLTPKDGSPPLQGRGAARLRGARHSRGRDRAAVQYHYDVGNEFYSLWLDPRMQYSCAYFPTGEEDLATAQSLKLDHICRKLRLRRGERLLDIGCGWGGLAVYAAERYGAVVEGVTLSENQAAYAKARISELGLGRQVSISLQDYRDLRGEPFDKIVSVGMFEHVGVDHLDEYFRHAQRLLKPGGLFLNHGISRQSSISRSGRLGRGDGDAQSSFWSSWMERWILGPGSFSQRYVFPDGELAPVSQVNLVAEAAGFEVRDVENLREHYALTLRHWVRGLEARRQEAIQATDEVTYRTWRLFMAASAHGFESGWLNVNQTLLSKPEAGRSHLPFTHADLYQTAKAGH